MFTSNIFLPLLGAICSGFFGKFIGKKGSLIVTTSLMFITFLLSVNSFHSVCLLREYVFIKLGYWIKNDALIVYWGFQLDVLSVIMLCVITLVSFLVHFYSWNYMSQDPHIPRFMSYLSFFTFFMILLVTGDNFLILFLGWEGVGLCSYLLINFWYTRLAANKSAIKAMILNRVGDVGLLMGVLSIYSFCNSLDFDIIFSLIPYISNYYIYILNFKINLISFTGFCLFIGSIGKSAQLGLHTWLPDAMEGPTPVSALIHAATMVTAGVFLIIRCSVLFEYTPTVLTFISFIGALTALFSATVGLAQQDIKKIIAFSTCSQLGYMIFACGLSNYILSFYHLVNHAFFKALLFLSAGVIIHGYQDIQDIRQMGNLKIFFHKIFIFIVIGNLALIGFPFFSGSFSKDLILEFAYSTNTFVGRFSYILGLLAAVFTAAYSMRLLYIIFFGKTNIKYLNYRNITNVTNSYKITSGSLKVSHRLGSSTDNITIIPLRILAIGSIFSGSYLKSIFLLNQTLFFKYTVVNIPNTAFNLNVIEEIPFLIRNLPLILILTSTLMIYVFYNKYHEYKPTTYLHNSSSNSSFNFNDIDSHSSVHGLHWNTLFRKIWFFFFNSWYFDFIYDKIFVCFTDRSSIVTYNILDQGFFEFFGPTGVCNFFFKTSNFIHNFYKNHFLDYFLIIFTSFSLVLIVIF